MKRLVLVLVFVFFGAYFGIAQVFYEVNPINTNLLLTKINRHFAARQIKFTASDFIAPPIIKTVGGDKYNTILSRTSKEISTIALNNLFGKIYYNENVPYLSEHFLLKSEKLLTQSSSNSDRSEIYANLADLYAQNGNYTRADFYYRRLLKIPSANFSTYLKMNAFTVNLIRLRKAEEASRNLDRVFLTNPPNTLRENLLYRLALSRCKAAKGEFSIAQKLISESLGVSETIGYLHYESLLEAAILSLQSQNPTEALSYLLKAKATPNHSSYSERALLFELLSNSYSLIKNYESAFEYLNKKKQLKDSVFQKLKFKNLLELEFQYENYKQSAELARREENIKLLKQNRRLLEQKSKIEKSKVVQEKLIAQKKQLELLAKQRNIDYLEKQLVSQESLLTRAEIVKRVSIVVVILLIIILFLIFRQFKLKIRSDKSIEQKNRILEMLVMERTWLMDEMHSQVKSNLTTIISLLKPKSTEQDIDVLEALKDSEHRIFAMSLIHEKLFRSENLSQVNIKEYIVELIANLNRSFSNGNHITIKLNIDPVFLDQGQAVPLGIIINEAVTNSFKYGFPFKRHGKISISFVQGSDKLFDLTIADNGVGLPRAFQVQSIQTLGFKLIKGLALQLEGNLEVSGVDGTRIKIGNIKPCPARSIIYDQANVFEAATT